jgi:YihY family inner membrane protein
VGSLIGRFDALQRRHKWLAVPVAVIKKTGDDGANREAAVIAWWGFFSLFPLLLLFTAILGFVLAGDPQAQLDIRDSAVSNFPVLGPTLSKGHLTGSGVALAVGIVGAVLSGIGVTLAVQHAFDTVYAVSAEHRPDFLRSRLRGLGLLVALGILQIAATGVTAVLSELGGVAANVLGIAAGLLINLVLFFAVFRMLTPASIPTRELRPGILIAAILWTALLRFGGIYTQHVVKEAGDTYGTFAAVIGLLTWLYVGARVLVYSAEINTVLTRRLWPRPLTGNHI